MAQKENSFDKWKDRDIILNHPHDHFRHRHLAVVPNTCFVLMPFDSRFTTVYQTIADALQGLMVCTRADDLPIGRPILDRILTGIRSSELLIADLTGSNPNVYYELGLAHTHTKNVLLLTQNKNEVPFDLRGLFCHNYSPHSREGLNKLADVVREAAKSIQAQSIPNVLDGATKRTEQIVAYMKRLLKTPQSHQELNGLIIRIQAGFSALANSHSGPRDEEEKVYRKLLKKERKCLLKLLKMGARLQAILHPPSGKLAFAGPQVQARFKKLLAFLGKDLSKRCEIVVSTEKGVNLLFFGEEILFEGHKTGVGRGYGWTMVYTDQAYLNKRLEIFDTLFKSAREHTLERYGSSGIAEDESEALRRATIHALELARDGTQIE